MEAGSNVGAHSCAPLRIAFPGLLWRPRLWAVLGCIVIAAALVSCGSSNEILPESSQQVSSPAPAAATSAPASADAPAAARYALEEAEVQILGVEDGLVLAEFSVAVRNLEDTAGEIPVPVEVVYGGITETVHTIESLPAGDVTRLSFQRHFPAGDYRVSVRVADVEALVEVDARVADITLEASGHEVVGNRAATLEVEVTNQGGRLADYVVLSTEWTPALTGVEFVGSHGSLERAAVITLLAPGETRAVPVPLYPVTGAYAVTVSADTGTIEIARHNNRVVADVAVDYVQLAVDPDFVRRRGYEQDGKGIVDIGFSVRNDGVMATGPLEVGISCGGRPGLGCSESFITGSIGPGAVSSVVMRVLVEQGETDVLVYAGAPEYGYRWGDGNVMEVTVDVPERPARSLILDTDYLVAGYWSDGTANVDITVHLRNEGYRPVERPQPVSVTCPENGEIADFCKRRLLMELPDGFSPASRTFTLRMPVDTWELSLDYGSDGPTSRVVEVPQRILGVRREVWECFSDRPGLLVQRRAGDYGGGCAGWGTEYIRKWSRDAPISVWATGREDYVAVFKAALEELSPLLNLAFRWVSSKDEADLEAYVGVPITSAPTIGLSGYCADALGCAKLEYDSRGVMASASIAVWLNEDESLTDMVVARESIRRTTLHEALHALLPVHHRSHPSSILNVHNALRLPYLSPMDAALFELHSHPLVQPGMTMTEVERLVVLADEMLDPPPPAPEADALELARRAFVALQESGSAGFKVSGGWTGRGCGGHTFGGALLADYEIGDFRATRANLVYLGDGKNRFFILDSEEREVGPEYWRGFPGGWERIDVKRLQDATPWRREFSSPHRMLASILFFADAHDIEVSEGPEGTHLLKVGLDEAYVALEWSRGETLQVVLELDSESYQIRQYRMEWDFTPVDRVSCSGFKIEARQGRYGIEVGVPVPVSEGSGMLP